MVLQYIMTWNENTLSLSENDKIIIFIVILVFNVIEKLLLNAMLSSGLWMSITLKTVARYTLIDLLNTTTIKIWRNF